MPKDFTGYISTFHKKLKHLIECLKVLVQLSIYSLTPKTQILACKVSLFDIIQIIIGPIEKARIEHYD